MSKTNASLMKRREAAVPRGVGQIHPIFAESAKNATVTDVEGREFIDFAGGIRKAICGAREYLKAKGKDIPIECEVRSLEDIDEVFAAGGADRIMFDNFTPAMTREAVKKVAGRCETESSGGITLDTIRDYAECGVDFISVGALTHQIKSLDMSLKACE